MEDGLEARIEGLPTGTEFIEWGEIDVVDMFGPDGSETVVVLRERIIGTERVRTSVYPAQDWLANQKESVAFIEACFEAR